MVDRPRDASDSSHFEFPTATAGETTARNPLSMALLFYIVTVSGILSACLRTLIDNPTVTGRALSTVVFIGIAIGFVSGGIIGWYHFKGRFAAAVASCVGIFVGGVSGALALVDAPEFLEVNGLAFIGCWLLILFMLLAARFSERSPIR